MSGSVTTKQLLLAVVAAVTLLFAQTLPLAHAHDHPDETLCMACSVSADGISTSAAASTPPVPMASRPSPAALPATPHRPRYRTDQPRGPPYNR